MTATEKLRENNLQKFFVGQIHYFMEGRGKRYRSLWKTVWPFLKK